MRRIMLIFAFGFSVLAGINPAQEASAECCGCREHLTGDMFGIRPGLAERGVVADLALTQF